MMHAQPNSSAVFEGKSRDRLFSENPFRRKPPGQQQSLERNENSHPTAGQTDLVPPQERKRERDRDVTPYSSDSEAGKRRRFQYPLTEKTGQQNGIFKKTKKRKWDEIEEEYEARKCGEHAGKKEGIVEAGHKKVGDKRKFGDEAAAMVVVKERFDDGSKVERSILVRNLPLKVKRKALLKQFKQIGEIETVRIRYVPIVDSKIPWKGANIEGNVNGAVDSVNAYIVFRDDQSVQAALSLNMTKIGDKHIRVERACPPCKKLKVDGSPLYNKKETFCVGNLPFEVKDAANMGAKKRNSKLQDLGARLYHAKSNSMPSTPVKRSSISDIRNPSPIKRLAIDASDRSLHIKSSKKRLAAEGVIQGNDMKSGGKTAGQVARKRKMESRTPENSIKGKKSRCH